MIPLRATGLLGLKGPPAAFLGTTFPYRSQRHFLTAAHCVGNADADVLAVTVLAGGGVWGVASVDRHPSADLALLALEHEVPVIEPFWNTVSNLHLAEEFLAFGYPENVLGHDVRQPTPRIFIGHFQRFFRYRSFAGYDYEAGEMSIPAPAGLSGGPLFRRGAPQMVTGLVAENFDSATQLQAVEDITSEGEKRTIRYQSVISYGVAVMLHAVSDWLDERVPSQEEVLEWYQAKREQERDRDGP